MMPTERQRNRQLESIASDHGQAIERVARGLANLTVTVQQEFVQVIDLIKLGAIYQG
jgi:hypothetical protein